MPKPKSKSSKVSARVENYERVKDQAIERKRNLKRNATKSELAFREMLNRLHVNHQFQKIVCTDKRYFILDFVLHANPRIIVEVDGAIHLGQEAKDAHRTKLVLDTYVYRNYRVERLTNEQVADGSALGWLKATYPKKWAKYGDQSWSIRESPAIVPIMELPAAVTPPMPKRPKALLFSSKAPYKEAGRPCRHCGTPVETETRSAPPTRKKSFYYDWWLRCPKCRIIYYVKSAKRLFGKPLAVAS